MDKRVIGEIITIFHNKGFGFIEAEGIPENIFFHFSRLRDGSEASLLSEGSIVEFNVFTKQDGKMSAEDVVINTQNSKIVQNRNIAGPTQNATVPKSKTASYYLPKDIRLLIEGHMPPDSIENFSIRLNRCPEIDPKQGNYFLVKKEGKGGSSKRISANFNSVPLKEINQRYKQSIASCNLSIFGPTVYSIDWRMILGLGQESVYETSMTLHHIYGIPYIPGQAIKGSVRNWMILDKFGGDEKKALMDQGFCDVFGCQAESFYAKSHRGKIIFFDALPSSLNNKSIHADIMNPHYAPYYGEEKPPADCYNPIPITFLTLRDASFQFFIGVKGEQNTKIQNHLFKNRRPLEVAQEFLHAALTEHGIGAKTATGYGYFKKTGHNT